ncbi:MAG: hypothetical protein M1817_003338 [Caeruleum heppii]|nr:MAG: hypothetical protein M1817_003338 [Caeruleum heppii]
MVHLTTAAFLAALTALASAQDTQLISCGAGQKCPDNLPCCSQYGQCGVGAYCLGGCDPLNSNSLESCVPAPVCESKQHKLNSLDNIVPKTKYLGDASKADWVSDGTPQPYGDSVLLTMAPDTVGTLLASSTYMWYGKVSATMKTSRARGVVTAFILLSDVKDEIDYEFVGTDLETAQSNYYFQGITNYANGQNISLSNTFESFHTYTIDWQPDSITWSVDGQVGRVLKRDDTFNTTSNRYDYPQTPSRVQLSLWPAGLPTNGEGTIEWAGGLIDFENSEDIKNNGYYYAAVSEVTIDCYDPPSNVKKSGSKSYIFTNDAGTQDAVEITDKPTVLKSLLGSGTNMSADFPSNSPKPKSGGSATSSASAPEETEGGFSIPGLSGAGTGASSGRGGAGSSAPVDGASGSGPSDSSDQSGDAGSASSSAAAAAGTGGFSQGDSSTNTNANSAPAQGERVLHGSVFAGLVALAAMLLL